MLYFDRFWTSRKSQVPHETLWVVALVYPPGKELRSLLDMAVTESEVAMAGTGGIPNPPQQISCLTHRGLSAHRLISRDEGAEA